MKEDVTKKPGRLKKNVDKNPNPVVGSSHQGANQMPTKGRRERVPLQGAARLTLPQRPGFFRYWAGEFSNVDPERSGKLNDFLNAGYTFIQEKGLYTGTERVDDSTALDSRVTKNGGGGTTLYAMEIPLEYYNADQLAKMERVDKTERDIKSRLESGSGRAYGQVTLRHGVARVPKGGGGSGSINDD